MIEQDRTCVITGASRGIGREIALELAEDGYNVVINYHSSEGKAAELVEQALDRLAEEDVVERTDDGWQLC